MALCINSASAGGRNTTPCPSSQRDGLMSRPGVMTSVIPRNPGSPYDQSGMGPIVDMAFRLTRPGFALFLVIHALAALFAPCPFRPEASLVLAQAAHGHHAHHAADLPSAPTSDDTVPCPYELMHLLNGVFQAAPVSRPALEAGTPLTFAVVLAPDPAGRVDTRRTDPPPRFAWPVAPIVMI